MQSAGWPVWVGDAGACPPIGAELIVEGEGTPAVSGVAREVDTLLLGLRSRYSGVRMQY